MACNECVRTVFLANKRKSIKRKRKVLGAECLNCKTSWRKIKAGTWKNIHNGKDLWGSGTIPKIIDFIQ